MLAFTPHLASLTTTFLDRLFDYHSQPVDGGSVTINLTGGRDSRAGLVFVAGNDDNTFPYGLYEQKVIPAAQTQTFGFAVKRGAQGTLGGRLLTLVDGGEDVFEETTQVGINVMSDGTLQAVRANEAGTGIILRGLDQGVDAQTTLLGTSTDTLTLNQADYLEIQVFHHSTAGSITAKFYVSNVLTGTWSLTDVNTAISGRNQSTSFCYGGFASVGISDSTRHHEDFVGTISDAWVINDLVNPDDSRDPITFIGDRASIVKTQTSNTESDWTPDPVQSNYLNVNELPPDEGSTENTSETIGDLDLGAMQPAGVSSEEEIYLAYSAYMKGDVDASCVSADPALFEAFVWMDQTDPGEVHQSANDTSGCNLTDFISRRAQTVCTISENGEQVTFKPGPPPAVDEYYVGLSPVDAMPRLQVPTDPSYYSMAVWSDVLGGNAVGTTLQVAGATSYALPWYQPWLGYSVDTQDQMDTAGDTFWFQLLNDDIGIDVGVLDNLESGLFNPYTSPLSAFHFRTGAPDPYFWIGPSFGYDGQTTYTYNPTDTFKIVRNDPNIEFWQNATLLESIAVTMPTHVNAFAFMGRWGWDGSARTLRPGIKQCFVQIGGSNCVISHYAYNMLSGRWDLFIPPEMQQWGLQFPSDFDEGIVMDPGSTHGPFPLFGYTDLTTCIFKLDGGNVVLEIHDYDYLDGISDVGGVGVYTYTIPFANTDDFALQTVIPVGAPDFPNSSLEYNFPTIGQNAPLRLVAVFTGNNGGNARSVDDVAFTFNAGNGPASYAGHMKQNTVDRAGTETDVPNPDYRYVQSFLASTPANTEITVDDYDEGTHGYERSA